MSNTKSHFCRCFSVGFSTQTSELDKSVVKELCIIYDVVLRYGWFLLIMFIGTYDSTTPKSEHLDACFTWLWPKSHIWKNRCLKVVWYRPISIIFSTIMLVITCEQNTKLNAFVVVSYTSIYFKLYFIFCSINLVLSICYFFSGKLSKGILKRLQVICWVNESHYNTYFL